MSSPVQDHLDKRYMYAPPWARETPQKSPQAILAAIERLRQERLGAAAPSPHDAVAADLSPDQPAEDRHQPELPLGERPSPIDIEAAMADAVRAAWTPPLLAPVTMPPPPKPRLDGPTWGMVVRLSSAVGFAAAAALFFTGAVPLPSIDISLNPNEGAKAAFALVQAFGVRDARGQKPAPVLVADASFAAALPASAPVASLPASRASPSSAPPPAPVPSEVLTAFASLDTSTAVASVPAGPKIESAPAAAAAPPEPRALDRDELAGLLTRGQALLAEGDIASARLALRRAAEAGDATAALTLAGTYDRAELARLKVIGVVHDHAQAKVWYTRAVAQGSAEAVRRLQQLAQRAD